MPYLFDVFHNFLYADTSDTPRIEVPPNPPKSDCFCLAVVEGQIVAERFKVKSNHAYPVYNSDFIRIETPNSRPKELLSAALDIDPDSILSFFLKQKDQCTRCYLMLQSKLNQYSKTQIAFYAHDKMLLEASQKIINTIDRHLFDLETRKQAEFYIQKLELLISNYITKIKSAFADDPEKINVFSDDLHQDLEKLYFRYLEMIQSHLEVTYAVYRDQNKQVTGKTLTIFATELIRHESSIKVHLQNNQIDNTLSKIILKPLRLISDQGECQETTHQKLNYLVRYAKELDKFFKTFDHVAEQELIGYLYVLNFNSVGLLSYIFDSYKRMKKEISDEQSLIDHLREMSTRLTYLPPPTLKPYHADFLDLKKQVRVWIKEEIGHLKKAIKQKEKEQADLANSTKLRFNYSVDVISGFFKLLHDAGVTTSGANHTIRWINQNISSKNKLHISQQSIQRKFFDKYINKEPVKEMLNHLINHLHKT